MRVKIIRHRTPLADIWYTIRYKGFILWHNYPIPFSKLSHARIVAEYFKVGYPTYREELSNVD